MRQFRAYLVKICTCKSFHDENSAHKYCKDEASLHCEFSDVLSKLFCLTKAVKFNFKQCHWQFEVKDYHFLNFFNSDGSQYIQITASVYSDTHTYTYTQRQYGNLLSTEAGRSQNNISKETKHCPNIHLDNIHYRKHQF